MGTRTVFDESYYRRYYLDPGTRAHNPEAFDDLTGFVFSYLRYLDQEVVSVIDIGCGLGHWRDALAAAHPEARYTGVEISRHACQTYGWEHGSVVDYRSEHPADLVICCDVVQYLDDLDAAQAIENLATMCKGALYFAALTEEDWLHHCDQARTDRQANLRTGSWYRHRLSRHFWNAGGGLFVSRLSEVVLYELERAP